MASPDRRLPTNVEGDFFVDSTCIDCGTCRWVAPDSFGAAAGRSRVKRQPEGPHETRRALLALVACPTASIGTTRRHDLSEVKRAFPDPVDEGVFHCGYHDERSFGAASWLVVRPEGNVLIDVPRFAAPLVSRIEEMGGVRTLFLTHRDDVAEHHKWAERFGAERVMHADDVTTGTRSVEKQLVGQAPVELGRGLLAIPTPGHTRGSACLLVDDRFLFTGDHLAYSAREDALYCFEDACWYDWGVQRESVRRLLSFRFEHVLPGHGRRVRWSAERMRDEVQRCLERMG